MGMQDFKRFAIYWAPEAGPLADFCNRWLGWDPALGRECAHPRIEGLPQPVEELTDAPRKYGLHATLKPPFRLVDGACLERLCSETAELAGRLAPVTLERLELDRIGRFLALTPRGDLAPLAALAAGLVRALDCFRAPLTPEDLIRRQASKLTGAQKDLLDRWGYPYVMEEFRFHVTLTGSLEEDDARATHAALAPILAPLLPEPFAIRDICLFGEAADGRFHLLHRYPLTGAA